MKKDKIAIITVPYVTNNDLYQLMVNSINSLTSKKYDLYHVAIINKCPKPWIDFVYDYANQIIENDENCLSMAWNKGIEMAINAGCEKIIVPNLDILARHDTIDNLIEALDKYDFAGAYTEGHSMANKTGIVEKLEGNPFSLFAMTKKCFDKVGKFDENFKPAYFEDNDYAYRMRLSNIKLCTVYHAPFIHYGSQTIHKDFDIASINNVTFSKNHQYFVKKWGGIPDQEVYTTPFNK